MPVRPRELPHEVARVVAAAQREARERQPGGPALGALHEPPDVIGTDDQLHPFQQGARLGVAKAEVRGAQLDELAAAAPAAER